VKKHPLFNLRGRDVLRRSQGHRVEILSTAFRYWHRRGFPHYRLTDREIIAAYRSIATTANHTLWDGTDLQLSPVGQQVATMFQPHIWSVPVYKSLRHRFRTPYERFSNPDSLRACLARAVRIWPERFCFRPSTVRRALMTYPNTAAAGNFRPTAAFAIYRRFASDGDRVLDFSAGYGGRLFGALAAGCHYVGIEPSSKNVTGMRRMAREFARLKLTTATPMLLRGCAEDVMPSIDKESFSLVFSSPPYFSKERYGRQASQSWRRYAAYDQWKDFFLIPVIAESSRLLKAGGLLVLNLGDPFGLPIVHDALSAASAYFELQRVFFLRLGRLPYIRSTIKSPYKYEPVLVFRKNPERAAKQLSRSHRHALPCQAPR
jgi:SAM-dependent methyltransferase